MQMCLGIQGIMCGQSLTQCCTHPQDSQKWRPLLFITSALPAEKQEDGGFQQEVKEKEGIIQEKRDNQRGTDSKGPLCQNSCKINYEEWVFSVDRFKKKKDND